MEPDDFEAMETLQSFEKVVFHIVPKFLEGEPVSKCFDETLEKAVDMVSAFRQKLELALGVAVEGLDNKGRYLAFRPFNNSTSCSGNIPVSLCQDHPRMTLSLILLTYTQLAAPTQRHISVPWSDLTISLR